MDVNQSLGSYREQLLSSAENVEILENKSDDLKELVKRLAGPVAPSSPRSEEPRDVLVRLSLLPVGRLRCVAFVSGDEKAFFKDGKLRKDLLGDLKGFETNVEAFFGLDEFLRVHHTRTSFIDQRWTEERIETKQVIEAYS